MDCPMKLARSCALLSVLLLPPTTPSPSRAQDAPAPPSLQVRGIHLSVPAKSGVDALARFIREDLAEEGVNTLILEVNTSFDFSSRPELADPSAPGKADMAKLAGACKEAGIELIPQLNCLGHQSWSSRTGAFLTKHPELDETPGKFPENKGIYCRSYCPLHPKLHEVLFPLLDELARACEAKAFHIGMDEVFILADRDCPRCGGKDPAALFAGEVTALRDHLRSIDCRTWMWGDRFLDGKATGIGEWEASTNGTAAALEKVPRDIVICDWHYEKAHETPRFFASKGFDVVACPWRKPDVALGQLAHMRALRSDPDGVVARHALGVVQTTWCGPGAFLKAYAAEKRREGDEAAADSGGGRSAGEAARCFRALFKRLREGE